IVFNNVLNDRYDRNEWIARGLHLRIQTCAGVKGWLDDATTRESCDPMCACCAHVSQMDASILDPHCKSLPYLSPSKLWRSNRAGLTKHLLYTTKCGCRSRCLSLGGMGGSAP